MDKRIKEKLGYTHIATGVIKAGLGLITNTHEISKHFEFFEGHNCRWKKDFEIEIPMQDA